MSLTFWICLSQDIAFHLDILLYVITKKGYRPQNINMEYHNNEVTAQKPSAQHVFQQ